ncbi:MAG: zf-HC2 domain-containing protein, partial [Planctomycetes bacterium]|nr:zf-HC2 domain-containing protein [Planctomycetota bacterium]
MDCEVFQSELPDLVYGELPSLRREQAEAHAEGCASCRTIYEEIKGIKGSLPPVVPPPQLGTRLKLMARDQLLAEKEPPPDRAGGPIHLAIVAILGACLAGFGVGVSFGRREGEVAKQPLPPGATLFPVTSPAAPSSPSPRPFGVPVPPQARVGWQRRLHEAGEERLAGERWEDAEVFFRRAAAVSPGGP